MRALRGEVERNPGRKDHNPVAHQGLRERHCPRQTFRTAFVVFHWALRKLLARGRPTLCSKALDPGSRTPQSLPRRK